MDKEFHRRKSKEHYAKYREKYLKRNELQKQRTRDIINQAKSVGCQHCSEQDLCCLDFHHLSGKDFNVSEMGGRNDNLVIEEIRKCVVLCANCHRKAHAGKITITPDMAYKTFALHPRLERG